MMVERKNHFFSGQIARRQLHRGFRDDPFEDRAKKLNFLTGVTQKGQKGGVILFLS